MKNLRQEKILELIEKFDIETQEELVAHLSAAGIAVTQATVSRDIRSLKLIKGVSAKGGYKYVRPGVSTVTSSRPNFNSAFSRSVIRIESAGNLVVVKTYPGMAQPVAACIDEAQITEILGCVAGDDAILVAVKNAEEAPAVAEKINQMMLKG